MRDSVLFAKKSSEMMRLDAALWSTELLRHSESMPTLQKTAIFDLGENLELSYAFEKRGERREVRECEREEVMGERRREEKD